MIRFATTVFLSAFLLFQIQPFQPLPRTYHQHPDWEARLHTLQTPAAWRRQCRVR